MRSDVINNLNPYHLLIDKLAEQIEEKRIISDPVLTFAYGTDASFYRLTPKIVLQIASLSEMIFAIKCCVELMIPITFRAAGTSLSGQAISDSVLIMLTPDWQDYAILNAGEQIRLQPGIIGSQANKFLQPYQRKIGPDPASINSCKIGGIVANNSSGMCCGTAQNSYQTLAGMSIVFADGTLLNTLDIDSVTQFEKTHQPFLTGITTLADACKNNTKLVEKINHKYRLKNTTGYSLNALIDYDDPIQIIQHLMVGSEGTLGFIADVTYNTVIDHQYKATGLFLFSDIEATCIAVTKIAELDVAAVELMDNRSLQSIASKPGLPDFIAKLADDKNSESAALLIEIHADNSQALTLKEQRLNELISHLNVIEQTSFSRDANVVAQLWNIRKELFPAVGAVRKQGTTVIIEDVAFPVEKLASAVRDLDLLFKKYQYHEAIIFGHALAGNLHFVFTQAFETESEIKRYSDFMDDIAQLVVVQYQGSLKAEHGTGRNMAPYVELEWGKDAYQLMQQLKALFDPNKILNPGVILNDNKKSHISNLKLMPNADPLIDKCIECGFCEAVCPSRNLSLTPRQRNAVYREICRLQETGEDAKRLKIFEQDFKYLGLDTCAGTGVCAERCPVDINTGDLVRLLRQKARTPVSERIAMWSSQHFSTLSRVAKVGLTVADRAHQALGTQKMLKISKIAHTLTQKKIPLWTVNMPRPVNNMKILSITGDHYRKVVYFPSCATRIMGTTRGASDDRSLMEVTQSLLEKAGIEVILPEQLNEQCCGMPYSSKGFTAVAKQKSKQLEALLWKASEQGKYPILMDTSPCASTSKDLFQQEIDIFEPFHFIEKFVLSQLKIKQQKAPIMLHITCTSRRQGLATIMQHVAEVCAQQVIIPDDIYCCGFAGDKGFNLPELNASALSSLKSKVPENCVEGYSNSITCEIGLSQHSGIEYRSILYLLDKVSLKS